MKIKHITLQTALALAFLSGCATAPPTAEQQAAIEKQRAATIISINPAGELVTPGTSNVIPDDPLNADKNPLKSYIDNVLNTVDKNKMVIYIHGGLGMPQNGLDKAKELTKPIYDDYKDDKGYNPVFIDWRSGPFTTYWEHLIHNRQGENWHGFGFLTAPLILVEDLGRGLSRAPMVWWYVAHNYVKSINFGNTDSEESAQKLNELAQHEGFGEMPNYELVSKDPRLLGDQIKDDALGIAQTGLGLVTAPLADALATGAWSMMKRRTEIMFTKAKPRSNTIDDNFRDYMSSRDGAATQFFRALAKKQSDMFKDNKKLEIVLVGHSMGAIIANKILSNFPEIKFEKIIYMAAACSIEDFQLSVLPYMRADQNKNTQFYSYMLHPIAENMESHAGGLGQTGSLLTQIDNFYEDPTLENQRTMGRWVNVMNGVNFLNDKDGNVKKRIYLRVMPLDPKYPSNHGDFDDCKFIESGGKFWTGELGLEKSQRNNTQPVECVSK